MRCAAVIASIPEPEATSRALLAKATPLQLYQTLSGGVAISYLREATRTRAIALIDD